MAKHRAHSRRCFQEWPGGRWQASPYGVVSHGCNRSVLSKTLDIWALMSASVVGWSGVVVDGVLVIRSELVSWTSSEYYLEWDQDELTIPSRRPPLHLSLGGMEWFSLGLGCRQNITRNKTKMDSQLLRGVDTIASDMVACDGVEDMMVETIWV